jgi:ribonuclease HII
MLELEDKTRKAGFNLVIGVDEAGRGPLAGPVVAAAVALRRFDFSVPIRDSKKLSHVQREEAFHEIYQRAYVGVGMISESVIDQADILQATFFAMHNAVVDLIAWLPPAKTKQKNFIQGVCLLVDGNCFRSDLPYKFKTIIKGDEHVLSIACASIVAKVTRDRALNMYHRVYPGYGFSQHKGYPTLKHKAAIRRLGPSLIQRRTFQCQL